jgi:hypothetical protein
LHPIFGLPTEQNSPFVIVKGESKIKKRHMRDINELHYCTGGAEVRTLQAIPCGLVFPDAEVSLA